MITNITKDLRGIKERLAEIEDNYHDEYEVLKELSRLSEKTNALRVQLEIVGNGFNRESEYLITSIMNKISQLQYEISGFDQSREIRRMFPNREDFSDYYDGEF